ncbi:MAG: tetratricopeptide repeat protein [Alphaproteobacteria bacterium]|nr:tetratricopeptide repeat protein [Alphaproteobacteria bacterium]
MSKTISNMRPLERGPLPYVILAVCVFAAYANVFANEFVFDDDLIIVMNSWIKDWDHIGDILTGSTTGGVHILGGFYRPLQVLLYLFCYQLGGGDAFWFHALNTALHVANACFVYKLGTKLGFDPKGVFFAALVWGVHPIHTEAVTYMSATADTLHAFFCLLGIIVLLPDFSPRKILAVIPLFLLGIGSKESMVIFPALVVVTLFFVSPERFKLRTYWRTWPLWLIALLYVYWRSTTPGFDGPQTYEKFYNAPSFTPLKLYAEHPLFRFYTFLATLPSYLRLLVWPTGLHMERVFAVQTEISLPVFMGFLMLATALWIMYWSFRNRRLTELGWGFLWFGAAHAPDTGLLIPMNALFLEHWMYLPSVGLALGLGQTLVALGKRNRKLAERFCAAATVLALVFAGKTLAQNTIWRDPGTFYPNIFANGAESARTHNNLALWYSKRGDYDQAIEQFTRAIAISDVYAETRFNLALVYLAKRQDKEHADKATENLLRSIEIQPKFYRSYHALGELYAKIYGDKAKADYYYAKGKQAFEAKN